VLWEGAAFCDYLVSFSLLVRGVFESRVIGSAVSGAERRLI
jgi:hypothetical protein